MILRCINQSISQCGQTYFETQQWRLPNRFISRSDQQHSLSINNQSAHWHFTPSQRSQPQVNHQSINKSTSMTFTFELDRMSVEQQLDQLSHASNHLLEGSVHRVKSMASCILLIDQCINHSIDQCECEQLCLRCSVNLTKSSKITLPSRHSNSSKNQSTLVPLFEDCVVVSKTWPHSLSDQWMNWPINQSVRWSVNQSNTLFVYPW